MPRIACIDFGLKRTGVAVTDPLRMIANGLETVETSRLMAALEGLMAERAFDTLVVGQPRRMNGTPSDIEGNILLFIEAFKAKFPQVMVARMDERFTSRIAAQTMIAAGARKHDRREKGNLDKISATLLLQEYLTQQRP